MKPRSVLQVLAAWVLAASAFGVSAQEVAVTKRSTELREKPAADAKAITNLPEKTQLKVISRSGGWTQVEAGANKGWVNVFHVSFPATVQAASGSGGGLSGLTSALGFGKPKTEQAKIATIGVRGLSEEELKNASPNPEALRKMQSFRADNGAATSFARDAKLAAQQVPYPGNP